MPSVGDLLGSGEELGMRFSYRVQERPEGLAQAFLLGEEFIADNPSCLILGDNIFYGTGFSGMLQRVATLTQGAYIFGYFVLDPRPFGVVEFDENRRVISIEEKPEHPKSNYAIPGLYFYDHTVVKKAKKLKPSARGELEITDLNRLYLEEGTLRVEVMGRGFAWLDTGNADSMLEAASFVETIQKRQGLYIACIEEIAWRNGWISTDQLRRLGQAMSKTEYGRYILSLTELGYHS